MTYNLGELTLDEIDLLALAMDFFLCNGDMPEPLKDAVEQLFISLDLLSEDAHSDADRNRLMDKVGNLLSVDFSPKSV